MEDGGNSGTCTCLAGLVVAGVVAAGCCSPSTTTGAASPSPTVAAGGRPEEPDQPSAEEAVPPAAATDRAAATAPEPEPAPRFTHRVGALGGGNDAVAPEAGHTLETAMARCAELGAAGFTFFGPRGQQPLPLCYFKSTTDGNDDPEWTTFIVESGTGRRPATERAAALPDEAEGASEASPAVAASDNSLIYCQRCAACPAGVSVCGERAEPRSLPICAYECVDSRATDAARRIVEHMLAHCPAAVLERLETAGCSVAVIGQGQVTSDMPPHHFLKGLQASLGKRS
jgi:hypothetical protein